MSIFTSQSSSSDPFPLFTFKSYDFFNFNFSFQRHILYLFSSLIQIQFSDSIQYFRFIINFWFLFQLSASFYNSLFGFKVIFQNHNFSFRLIFIFMFHVRVRIPHPESTSDFRMVFIFHNQIYFPIQIISDNHFHISH